jgi:cation diffusion facilitator CzcD-associated flavoprotein CzcO
MSAFTVRGKRVVVVGGAASGVAAARLLAGRGAAVTLTDLRPATWLQSA